MTGNPLVDEPTLTNFAVGYRYPGLTATPAEATQALTDADAVRTLVRTALGLPPA